MKYVLLPCILMIAISFGSALEVRSATYYVAPSGGNVIPFDSWVNAATTIQAAVDRAMDGDLVLVTNGLYNTGGRPFPGYDCTNRLLITNDITVRSLNGPEVTVIAGAPSPFGGCGSNAVRGVFMTAGLLDGFTMTNGCTYDEADGFTYQETHGGGAYLHPEGMLSNCVITGNRASSGGGVFGGIVHGSVISGNMIDSRQTNSSDAGGVHGRVVDSVIKHNVGGCAVYVGPAINCLIVSNTGTGIRGYFVDNPDVTNAVNCTISHNNANAGNWWGGGASYCTLYNCLISRNVAREYGGGAYHSILVNCTVADNELRAMPSSLRHGKGLYKGRLFNSIVGRGPLGDDVEDLYEAHNSCYRFIPEENGNTREVPQFIAPDDGDYRLSYGSPCIDSGAVIGQVTNDLDGRPRPMDGDDSGTAQHDMGCYEYDAAAYDSDGDGLVDFDEAVAMTSPTNRNDYFQIDEASLQNGGSLVFRCSDSRLYSLEYKDSLLDPEWIGVSGMSNLVGDASGTMCFTVDVDTVSRVYRIGVRMP